MGEEEGRHVPCQNFKPFHLAILKGLHVTVGILTQVMLFVIILLTSMLLFQCCVACWNFVTPMGGSNFFSEVI